MKFGFYVSNHATRIKKAIRYVSRNTELSHYLSRFAFVYRDCECSDELGDICSSNGVAYFQKEVASLPKQDRSDVVSSDLLSLMVQHDADYLFSFGCRLLRGEILKKYDRQIINFHPSLLPAFHGLYAIDQAVKYGSFLAGNTAHFIDEGMDTGPIIMQNLCILKRPVDYDRILDNQILMMLQIVSWLIEHRVRVHDRNVTIENAGYEIGQFIPRLENTALRLPV